MAEKILPESIQVARLRLTKDYPYLATAAWTFIPVESEQVPIMGTDKYWRLYYNPETLDQFTSEEITGVLYHEILHHLREHLPRAEMHGYHNFAWNIAADMEINDDLRRDGVKLPEGCIYPEQFINRHTQKPEELWRMAEEYYDGFERKSSQCSCDSSETDSENSDGSGDESTGSPQSGGSENSEDSEGSDGCQSQGDGTSPDQSESSSGSGQGQSDGSQSSESSGSGTTTQPDPNCPQHGKNGIPASSASGTQKADWELQDTDGSTRKVDKTEGELVRRKVAEDVQKQAKSRGDVPDHLERWAKEKLQPQVPWRQVLRGAVRRVVAEKMGAVDYTYRRISRRQSVFPRVVLPALRQPTPKVMIGIDTSGSMSDKELSQGLAEVQGCLKAIGVSEIEVFTVDAKIQTSQHVSNVRKVKMAGGGGTDMSLAIQYAEEQRQKPDILVVFTDGWTPWPKTAPKNIKTVVAYTQESGPAWAHNVKVDVS